MDFRILGNLEITAGERRLPVGAPREQIVLGVLLLDAGRVVPVTRLVDALWPDDPPATAVTQVRNAVSRLRRLLGDLADCSLGTAGGGYRLAVPGGRLDTWVFEAKVDAAARAASDGQLAVAAAALRDALGLWRGRLLEGLGGQVIDSAAAAWETRRRAAEDAYFEYMLTLGRHRDIVAELSALLAADPLRETTAGQLMLALYRSANQAAALETYQATRARLRDDLGVDPGPQLRRLHRLILNHDPELELAADRPQRVVPRQLPATTRHFTGRRAELKELADLLGQADDGAGKVVISAITGTAGVGKTVLALQWAHQAAEHFPDGQLYVNLRGFDPTGPPMSAADAIRGFLEAFEIPAVRIPESFEAQAGLYRSLMADKRALVVLDNARDVAQVRPLLPGSAGCLAIITSRSEFTGLAVANGAQLIPLDLFSDHEVRDFLSRRLGAERVTVESDAVSELTALCAGLPLALSIVAARALNQPGVPLSAFATQLRDVTRRLDTLDSGEDATSIRSVLSWSYQNLSSAAARMFRLLAMHPGPDISAAAAASLAGVSRTTARPILGELTGAHMLAEAIPGRFAFHDLLRAYADEKASATDSAGLRRAALNRVIDYYLFTGHGAALLLNPGRDPVVLEDPATEVTPDLLATHTEALAWFTAECRVLFAVITQAAAERFDSHAWKIPWTLMTFLESGARWRDLVAVQRTALAAAQRQQDSLGLEHAHRSLGYAYVRLGRHNEAITHLQQALVCSEGRGDQTGVAHSHLALGWAFAEHDRHAAAIGHAREAISLFTAAGHRHGQASALNCAASCLAHLGDTQGAIGYGEQALELQRELKNRIAEADTWDTLGFAYHRAGQFDRAVWHYLRAIDLCRQLGDRYTESEVRLHISDAHHGTGDIGAARDALQQALVILEELEHPNAEVIRARLRELTS